MVSSFSKVTTAKMWRFAVIHSLQQANAVLSALEKVCNCGVEAGIWEKPNIHIHPAGNRLAWAFENWTIGYYSEAGSRNRDMYNFLPDESRSNIVKVPCVTKKSLTSLGAIVNPYQKLVLLSSWFVKHFSEKGDWVADLCAGTGSTLVAALLESRHGSCVELSSTQIEFIKGRIMTLDPEWTLYEECQESGTGNESMEVQPPILGSLGTILTTAWEIIEDEEEEEEEVEEPVKEASPDYNAMLND